MSASAIQSGRGQQRPRVLSAAMKQTLDRVAGSK
jgi:hypothetical protein